MKHSMNQRRRSLVILGAGALTAELTSGITAHAQGNAPPARIGWIAPTNAAAHATRLAAFKQGMLENGLIEGTHYVLDAVYAEGRSERFPVLVKELMQRGPVLIVSPIAAAIRAAQQAAPTLPIVMISISDPVGRGLVASLARPGGNITGLSNQSEDTTAKFVEFLREALPRAKRIALLVNPGNSSHAKLGEQVRVAALQFGIETRAFEAAIPDALDATFAAIARERPDALVVLRDAMFLGEPQPQRISAFALKNRIAAFGSDAVYADAGSLLSYGPSNLDMFRRSATYVKKILAGAKPADLPVEQPTKFELVINGKTAKALGLTIPRALLISAEKVIE